MKIRDSGMPPEDYWQTLFNVELILEKLLINEKITDAAEFGSGYGTFSIPAAKKIKGNLFALDIEDEMIHILNKKNAEQGIQNIKVIKTDFMKHGTGLQNNSVDYVMMSNILHAEEPVQLLNESFRILKPGGKAGIIHWIYSDETPRGPSLNIIPKPKQCINWLIKSGFKILKEKISLPPYHYGLVGFK
ncbi:MAG: class I SAM-dependent methyltransferase [Ignavibacteriales bacterium]|nr:MAG: class I SAM-dependent methyltransferase [Ignavibacteriales bacterium]